jgi:hypothetical protein
VSSKRRQEDAKGFPAASTSKVGNIVLAVYGRLDYLLLFPAELCLRTKVVAKQSCNVSSATFAFPFNAFVSNDGVN